MHSFTFDAIGTAWAIETSVSLDVKVQSKIERTIESFDVIYSRFRDDSLVRHMATQGAGVYQFPDSIKDIFEFYDQLHKASQGRVTPLIGSSLEGLGYDKDYSLKAGRFSPAPSWSNVVSLNGTELRVGQKITLDIGAAGKGYLVDCIANLLKESKIESFVIDASGDIYTHNAVQRIGLENPYDTTKVLGVATIENQALCASSVNRRSWGDGLHHILDPSTGMPVDDVVATWVVADTTMHADGIATALFFVPPENLHGVAEFSYAVLRKDGSMLYSKNNTWEVFA